MPGRRGGEEPGGGPWLLGCALVVVAVVLLFTSWRWVAILPGGLGVWLLVHEPRRRDRWRGRRR